MAERVSYHDLHVTTADIPRTALSSLPHGYEVVCNRVSGWALVRDGVVLAEEFGKGLRLDLHDIVIVDSLTPQKTEEQR